MVFGRGTFGSAETTEVATSTCAIEANAGRRDNRAYTKRYASRMPAFFIGRINMGGLGGSSTRFVRKATKRAW